MPHVSRNSEAVALRALSARIGADACIVQGAGGNTSLKDGDSMLVKASGTWLEQALASEIFVDVNLARIRRNVADGCDDPCAGAASSGVLRPSLEAALHAVLPQRVVLHVHCVDTIAIACRRDGRDEAARRLAGLPWVWVPYRRPGLPLAQAAIESLRGVPDAAVLILANHGLAVGAASCAEAEVLLADVRQRLAGPLRSVAPPGGPRLSAALSQAEWRLPAEPRVHALALDEVARSVCQRGALVPDQVVFLGPLMQTSPAGHPWHHGLDRSPTLSGTPPPYLVIEGEGVVVSRSISPGAEAMLACVAEAALRLPSADDTVFLTADDTAALLGWEAEAYRQTLN